MSFILRGKLEREKWVSPFRVLEIHVCGGRRMGAGCKALRRTGCLDVKSPPQVINSWSRCPIYVLTTMCLTGQDSLHMCSEACKSAQCVLILVPVKVWVNKMWVNTYFDIILRDKWKVNFLCFVSLNYLFYTFTFVPCTVPSMIVEPTTEKRKKKCFTKEIVLMYS